MSGSENLRGGLTAELRRSFLRTLIFIFISFLPAWAAGGFANNPRGSIGLGRGSCIGL